MLEKNQYTPSFFNPIIKQTLKKIQIPKSTDVEEEKGDPAEEKLIFIQYRGEITEQIERSLKRLFYFDAHLL